MQPFFSGTIKPQRQVNLGRGGGLKTATDVLEDAARLRRGRDDQRRQEVSARTVQRVYRSSAQRREVKRSWRADVDEGRTTSGLDAVRKVVFGWEDGQPVSPLWWQAVASGSPPSILLPLHATDDQPRFIVLLKMLVIKILTLASTSSQAHEIAVQLNVLVLILSPTSYPSLMAEQDYLRLTRSLSDYACAHGGIALVAQGLRRIPSTDRKHPNTPLLISILALLLSPPTPDRLASTLSYLIPLPLLPNRLPIPSLTTLVKSLPLLDIVSLAVTLQGRSLWSSWDRETRLDALGNLAAFGVARMSSTAVKPAAKTAWCTLLTDLLGGLTQPIEVSSSIGRGLAAQASVIEDDPDDEPSTSASGSPRKKQRTERPPPPIAPKLKSHLSLLASTGHLNAVLSPTPTPAGLAFVLAIIGAWPAKSEVILSDVAAKRGLVKDLWRSEVRGGAVMRKVLDGSKGAKSVLDALADPSLKSSWTSFLLLTLLHTHMLHTLGDDEFFDSPTNPLSLDETVSLSAIFRNIAFALYWNTMPEGKFAWGWTAEEVRNLCERAMAGVYERDQRQPFTPIGHWLMTEQFDVNSFVEAAISEEHEIDAVDEEAMDVDDDGVPIPAPPRPKKTLSRRHLAFLSPRLGVLNNIPQTVPFELRVEIFRAFIVNDRRRLGIDRYARNGPRYHTTIRRGKVAEDSYAHLNAIGAGLKNIIQITFKDTFGQDEMGIDGGGVFKELLTELSAEVFNTDRGLWQATKQQELYPSPTSYAAESHQLDWFQFIGRVLGKALYEGILVDVAFAGFFLSKWLGRSSYFDDLKSLDEELYRGLIQLKQYDGDFNDLALTFTVDVQEFGVTSTVELLPGGAQIAVTKENRLRYIDLISSFKLNAQIRLQTESFFVGLADIIDPRWIRMFDPRELQTLVGGLDTEIDLSDLRNNTVVHGLSEATERAFWSVVKSFDPNQRRQLIKFVTSSPRPPMLGFRELSPSFSIRAGAPDPTRLPTSATCINLLKLPPYRDERTLREKLLQAISSESGFDLS